MDERVKQTLDPTMPEGATSAYIQDVIGDGIAPNAEAPTPAIQDADAALYEQLRIIPSAGQTAVPGTETLCIYAGLAALRAAQANAATVANYLIQLYGYDQAIAEATAQSVLTNGTVFGAPLPPVPPGGFNFGAAPAVST